MSDLSKVPEKDREHFMPCLLCSAFFDMRDLGQVVEHEHWPEAAVVAFSHSVKKGKEDEVHVPSKRGMVTLRYASRTTNRKGDR